MSNVFEQQWGQETPDWKEVVLPNEDRHLELKSLVAYQENADAVKDTLDKVLDMTENPATIEEAQTISDNMDIVGMERLLQMRIPGKKQQYATEELHPAVLIAGAGVIALIMAAIAKYFGWIGGVAEEIPKRGRDRANAADEQAPKWGEHTMSLLKALDTNDREKVDAWKAKVTKRIKEVERGMNTPMYQAILGRKWKDEDVVTLFKGIIDTVHNLKNLLKSLEDLAKECETDVKHYVDHPEDESKIAALKSKIEQFYKGHENTVKLLAGDTHCKRAIKEILITNAAATFNAPNFAAATNIVNITKAEVSRLFNNSTTTTSKELTWKELSKGVDIEYKERDKPVEMGGIIREGCDKCEAISKDIAEHMEKLKSHKHPDNHNVNAKVTEVIEAVKEITSFVTAATKLSLEFERVGLKANDCYSTVYSNMQYIKEIGVIIDNARADFGIKFD